MRRMDHDLLLSVPDELIFRLHADSLFIAAGNVVVLVQRKAAVRSGEHFQDQPVRIGADAVRVRRLLHGNDAAGLCQDGNVLDAAVHFHGTAALIDRAGKEIDIGALREPYLFLRPVQSSDPGGGHRHHDQLRSKIILIGNPVRLLLARLIVIHGQDQRRILRPRAMIHGIQIGNQLMAQAQEIIHGRAHLRLKAPGLLAVKLIFRAVQPVDGRKYAQLIPAPLQLVVLIAVHVPADVMAPPAVADVGRRAGEIGLEPQGFPGDHRVSGKAHGISVGARPRVTGEGHRPLSVPGIVQEMEMVQHPERIQPLHFGDAALLPVDPPEIHAPLFIGMMDVFKIGGKEGGIRDFKGDRLFFGNILSQLLRHGLIHFLKSAHAVRRMHVQRDLHAPLMKRIHEPLRIREEIRIPGIARPARSVFGIDMDQMPVHVNHRHGKGDPFLVKPVHQLQIALFGIFIITAPPVPQRITGKHGRFAAQMIKISQAAQIVRAVSPEIKVLHALLSRLHPAVLIQRQRRGIIQQGKALSGNQAVSQLTGAVHRIQRPRRSLQIMQLVPVVPGRSRSHAVHLHHQPSGIEGLPVIGEPQPLRHKDQLFLRLLYLIIRLREIPVQDRLRGPVLKDAVLGILQTQKSLRQHRNPVLVPFYHICLFCFRPCRKTVDLVHAVPSPFPF